MVSSSQVLRTPKKGIKLGLGPVSALVLAAAAIGTFFGRNLVSEDNTVGLVAQTRAHIVATSTGSRVASGATTATLYLPTPFGADAADHGYHTGSGNSFYRQLDIISNPTGAKFTCAVVNSSTSGTGGTKLFVRISGTGSFPASGAILSLGPTQGFACYTLDRINSNTRIRLKSIFTDSDVIN